MHGGQNKKHKKAYLVRSSEVCKFVLGTWVILVSIWVKLQCQLSVGFLDVFNWRWFTNPQNCVEIPPENTHYFRTFQS